MFSIRMGVHPLMWGVVLIASFGCGDGVQRQTPTITGPSGAIAAVTAINILGLPAVLRAGSEVQLTAIAVLQDGQSAAPKSTAWKSSDPSVATVSDGVLRALGPDEVRISTTVGETTSTVSVRVRGSTTLKGLVTEPRPPRTARWLEHDSS